MRWIDLHPSASSSDFGETDPTERPRDADVLGAAFAMHRTALRATEDAHRAAARAWESTDTATRAATLRNRAGAAHLARADSYRQKSQLLERNGTVSSQSGVPVTRESIRAVAAEDELGPESLPSPRRIVEQALDATAGLPSGETGVSRPRLPVRVGLLAGPRLESGFLGAADILSLTSEDWAENLEEIDLLIVGSETSESPEVLEDAVIPACQERTIPTVFFSTASGDDVDATLVWLRPVTGSSPWISRRCRGIGSCVGTPAPSRLFGYRSVPCFTLPWELAPDAQTWSRSSE